MTGIVNYDDRPAAGKRITLDRPGGGSATVVATDSSGRFTFNNVAAGRWQVSYTMAVDQAAAVPNEVQSWRSQVFEMVDGAGKEVPAFEVSYGGLLFPEAGIPLNVTAEAALLFHWSTHRRAQRYRVILRSLSPTGPVKWPSPWVADPSTYYNQEHETGRYYWSVEIDGGDSGQGVTPSRQVDL